MHTLEANKPVQAENAYSAHESAADFLGKLASSEFGVNFSEKTLSNWKQALRVIMRVDNIFDAPDSAAKEAATLSLRAVFMDNSKLSTRGLDTETLDQSIKLRSQIDQEQAVNFVTKGLQVVSIGQTMRTVGSPRELARLTMLEGQMTTTMLLHLIDPADRRQQNLPDFTRFLRVGSRAANVIDSIADLKTDFNEGITMVEPSIINRLLMVWESLPEVKKSISAIGALAILKKMPSATVRIIRDRHRTPAA